MVAAALLAVEGVNMFYCKPIKARRTSISAWKRNAANLGTFGQVEVKHRFTYETSYESGAESDASNASNGAICSNVLHRSSFRAISLNLSDPLVAGEPVTSPSPWRVFVPHVHHKLSLHARQHMH